MIFPVSGFISILLLIEVVKQRIKQNKTKIQCRSEQKVGRVCKGEIKTENGDGKTLPNVG